MGRGCVGSLYAARVIATIEEDDAGSGCVRDFFGCRGTCLATSDRGRKQSKEGMASVCVVEFGKTLIYWWVLLVSLTVSRMMFRLCFEKNESHQR